MILAEYSRGLLGWFENQPVRGSFVLKIWQFYSTLL